MECLITTHGTATITAIHTDECAIEINTSGTVTAGMVFRKAADGTHGMTYYRVNRKNNGWYYLSKNEFSWLQVNDSLTYGDGYGIYGGTYNHLEGTGGRVIGTVDHVEGIGCIAYGTAGHAEGSGATVNGSYCHVEGSGTASTVSANAAHAEGVNTLVTSRACHAEGDTTEARGQGSHTEGYKTITYSDYQHVQGQYNVRDDDSVYAHIVGNGSSVGRSNAHTLDWQGNAWYAGDVYVGSTSGTNKDAGSKKLATEDMTKVNYSTTEQVIGTWINGKPLYRRLLTGTIASTSSDGTYSNVTADIADNIDFAYIKLQIAKRTDDTVVNMPRPYIDFSNQVWTQSNCLITSAKKLQVSNSTTELNQGTYYVWVEYTKTTDTASV